MNGAISYTVSVYATIERVEKAGKEWAQTGNENPTFAYTPEIEKWVRREVKLYEQVVETLDMATLVAVVNAGAEEVAPTAEQPA